MAHLRQKPRGTGTNTTARLDNGGQTDRSLLASTDGSFLASAEDALTRAWLCQLDLAHFDALIWPPLG